MQEIDARFATPDFYGTTAADRVRDLQIERSEVEREVQRMMEEWELGEAELG